MVAENDEDETNREAAVKIDPYALTDDFDFDENPWSEKNGKEKLKTVVLGTVKLIFVLGFLYLFICSLGLMGSAFQVLAGKTAGDIFSRNEILANPVTGLIIGILVTVLVQSSSTSTSIFITMTSAGLISVRSGIPLIMGANIGTSVTNTIVSLSQAAKVEVFRKSFAGATVHDVFNLLSVLILLPIELITHYLEAMTGAMVPRNRTTSGQDAPDFLKVITKPLTSRVIKVNKTIIEYAALGKYLEPDSSMVKIWCDREKGYINRTETVQYFNDTGQKVRDNETELTDTRTTYYVNETELHEVKVGTQLCTRDDFLFANTGMPDGGVGAILLIVSLVAMCLCLTGMVKLLSSMLKGNLARIIKKVINTNFPKPFGWITGYLAILVGAGLTFLVQSSSVFTSSITPLVGIGVISLKRMYPLTLGSNIGTTATGLLAAYASSGSKEREAIQLGLCHFFFNISGIIIWYPIPHLRRVPVSAAKALGNKTAKHRWFAVAYLIFVFFLFPALILGLSIAHEWALWSFLILIGLILIAILVISVMQSKAPDKLPVKLQTWDFLPKGMHSLKPYDVVCGKCCKCCKQEAVASEGSYRSTDKEYELPAYTNTNGRDNKSYERENGMS